MTAHRRPIPRQSPPPYTPTEVVLAGGQRVDLMAPRHDLDMVGIAEMLAKTARFNGASNGNPWSVAQHSLLVARILCAGGADPRLQLEGLIHDAAEALIGDITTPVKRFLETDAWTGAMPDIPARSWRGHIDRAHNQLMQAVYASLGVNPPGPFLAEAVRLADRQALLTEWRDLMPPDCPPPADGTPAAIQRLIPHPWPAAQEDFLTRLTVLAIDLGLNGPAIDPLIQRGLLQGRHR